MKQTSIHVTASSASGGSSALFVDMIGAFVVSVACDEVVVHKTSNLHK